MALMNCIMNELGSVRRTDKGNVQSEEDQRWCSCSPKGFCFALARYACLDK